MYWHCCLNQNLIFTITLTKILVIIYYCLPVPASFGVQSGILSLGVQDNDIVHLGNGVVASVESKSWRNVFSSLDAAVESQMETTLIFPVLTGRRDVHITCVVHTYQWRKTNEKLCLVILHQLQNNEQYCINVYGKELMWAIYSNRCVLCLLLRFACQNSCNWPARLAGYYVREESYGIRSKAILLHCRSFLQTKFPAVQCKTKVHG